MWATATNCVCYLLLLLLLLLQFMGQLFQQFLRVHPHGVELKRPARVHLSFAQHELTAEAFGAPKVCEQSEYHATISRVQTLGNLLVTRCNLRGADSSLQARS